MTKEEFITERTRIISEMLDNPDKYGLYPTTRCFTELDLLYDKIIFSLKSQLSEAGEEKKLTNDEILKEAEIRFPYDKDGIPDSHEYSFVEGAEWARDWQSR